MLLDHLPEPPVKLTVPAAALFLTAGLSALGATSYARWAAQAPTVQAAAPFALPFMLLSTTAASAAALGLTASLDAAGRRRS